MPRRLTLVAVALVSLVVGLAAARALPRFGGPSPGCPDEPGGPDQNVLVVRTDPDLSSPAEVTITGEFPSGRRWVFSFRDPEAARRASFAARDAATAEHRRALEWP